MTTQLRCNDCGTTVGVERRDLIGLVMTCDCPDATYSIKTAMALPGEWSA